MFVQGFAKKSIVIACSVALAAGAFAPAAAYAESSEVQKLRQEAEGMSAKIEEATAAYQEAEAKVIELEERIADNEARTAEIEEKLPEQRERAATSIRALYIFQQSSPGLLDLILSAENFNEFISTVSYLDNIHERNTNEIRALADLNEELISTQAELSLEYDAAEQVQTESLAALEEARNAKRELQRQADAIAAREEKERAEAVAAAQRAVKEAQEKAAREQAEREAQAERDQQDAQTEEPEEEAPVVEPTFTTSSGNTARIEVPEESPSVSTEPMITNTTSQETDDWAARIDAYLAGSPLAGYGATFAKAAAQYGVDPRFSPAISCIESSKGAVCFLPHNAWGWGSSSWGSWEEAINDHVAGLASMYGGTLTLESARMYCPPTYQEWYSSVLSEMNSI